MLIAGASLYEIDKLKKKKKKKKMLSEEFAMQDLGAANKSLG